MLATVMVFASISFLVSDVQADIDPGVDVLLDEGNGHTEWLSGTGSTVGDIIKNALETVGHTYDSVGPTVDGLKDRTVGGSDNGGKYYHSGTTGVMIHSSWHLFGWNGFEWVVVTESNTGSYEALSIAFYPDGIKPVITPVFKEAYVMSRGDAYNSGSVTTELKEGSGYATSWTEEGVGYSTALYAKGSLFYKFGLYQGAHNNSRLECIDPVSGHIKWTFAFDSDLNYESTSPLIVGDSIYFAALDKKIHCLDIDTGLEKASFDSSGKGLGDEEYYSGHNTRSFTEGTNYNSGFSSMVFDSGAIYITHSNGTVYCFNTNLELVWSYVMDGSTYLVSPTVYKGVVFVGALNGHLYTIDSSSGDLIKDSNVYQKIYGGKTYGCVGQVQITESDNGKMFLYFTVSDGLGMNQTNSGVAVYSYDPSTNKVDKVVLHDDGKTTYGRYMSAVMTDDFTGAYYLSSNSSVTSLNRIGSDGTIKTMVSGLKECRSPMVLVNGEHLFAASYSGKDTNYILSVYGFIEGTFNNPREVNNFNMMPVTVIAGMVFGGTDGGIYALTGGFAAFVPSEGGSGIQPIFIVMIVGVLLIIVFAVVWTVLSGKGIDNPFVYIKKKFVHALYGTDISHNSRSKNRLKFMIAIGLICIFLAFTLCICIGPTSIVSPIEAYKALFSAIGKGGNGLDLLEMSVYTSRLPRTIAALAVGIGLSVAGCVYQAIIRNPMVDPYIMGVSSGAGIAAIAVIAFNFTLFGLFSPHSVFLTAIVAMIGGLIAFACTMLLAERSGGSSINYVLAGIVIGLAAGALQSLMLTMAGTKLSNALTWLYGSFAEITWSQVWIIFFLSIALSLVPLMWAKELNLVLLGEDQAQQMGLNVRKFNRMMLILASVLTSVCVAFVGIIGFVGLVVPHLCRMLFGSDHRMVLPASICFGGVMLMLADLLARAGYNGMELPVGAITTVIGIPVFAYLLIKRGRMYDG